MKHNRIVAKESLKGFLSYYLIVTLLLKSKIIEISLGFATRIVLFLLCLKENQNSILSILLFCGKRENEGWESVDARGGGGQAY